MLRASLAIFFLVVLAGCAGSGRRSSEQVEVTRKKLLDLRPQVDARLKEFSGNADGIPLLARKGGELYLSDTWEGPEEDEGWVLDGWGHPIVLVLSAAGDPADWCLLSAGPDGVWTADPPEAREDYEKDRWNYPAFSPEDSRPSWGKGKAWVLGDDVVLHSSGKFFETYPFAVPGAGEVAGALALFLEGKEVRGLKVSEGLAVEIMRLSPEEKGKILKFLEKYGEGFHLEEVKADRDRERKTGGFLPLLKLCHAKLYEDRESPIRIVPTALGWYLSGDLAGLLADASGPIEFLGRKLEGDGLFFAIEIPDDFGEDRRLRLKQELIQTISRL